MFKCSAIHLCVNKMQWQVVFIISNIYLSVCFWNTFSKEKKNREDKALSPRRDRTLVANCPPAENSKVLTIYLSAWFLKYMFLNIQIQMKQIHTTNWAEENKSSCLDYEQATIALDATYTENSKLEKQKDTSVDQECRQQTIYSKNADFLPMKEIESSPILCRVTRNSRAVWRL